MQPIGIIGAMAQEVSILADRLESRECMEHAGSVFYRGRYHGIDVVILQSGIGKVNAAVGTATLLERYRPGAIINTGSAGGFADDLRIGDIIVSSEVRHHDVDVTAFGYELGQVPGMPAAFAADARLRQTARHAVEALGEVRVREGMIATGDSFMADPERTNATRAAFPTMLAVDMEAAAIAQACHLFGCPFVVVRALSDLPGDGDNYLSFDEFLTLAAERSSRMVDAMLRQLARA